MNLLNETLNIKNLSISFDDEIILNNFHLSLNKGEVISIVGPSGCGKSTILKCITKTHITYSGSINLSCSQIGYMPQDNLLLPFKSAKDNILLPNKFKNSTFTNQKSEELYELFNLTKSLEKFPNELSGGLKSRVALLRTYLMSQELFILDEPFSKLDMITKIKLQKFLKSFINEQEISVLLVTHDIHEAIDLSNQVIVLNNNGDIINTYSELTNKEEIYESILSDLKIS